ncbi:flagellar basal body rod protein FlgB [Thermodesulfobacterium sp. TA1]|uniref:flagellar basal body rod protein FlgB n=1 Tax=Thermodesulfobacterium sp. TA1 TaxID=2234087 RepID=UPI001231F916|nr:flagellar basal body rod protein FlgB [Thermodesulfobacterium sp. TA1]QER41623.1 flagellar basal body rod protein FlgB [Thermodesulfobacterium sp. TA1]
MWGLFEKTFNTVKLALNLRAKKHSLLASNIANVDTPGYRRRDLPFEKIMQTYLSNESNLKTTRPKHFTGKENLVKKMTEEMERVQTLGTPNNVSLEEEISLLTENQLMYEATLQALAKELERLKEAITEGGK